MNKQTIFMLVVFVACVRLVLATENIYDAAAIGDEDALRLLIEEKAADINMPTKRRSNTPLHYAASAGQVRAAELLIENGAKVNARNRLFSTPLHIAALKGHEQIVDILIEAGADVNARNYFGLTPLHKAVRCGHATVMETLVLHGADVQAKTRDTGLTPLHWASLFDAIEAAQLLLEYGADVNAVDAKGATPLAWAKHYAHTKIIRLLGLHHAR